MKRLRTNRFCVNKILIGSLTVCMLLGAFSGCGGTGTSDSSSASGPLKELSEVPEYTEEKKMWIGGWNSPPATEAAYTYAEDGGVNMLWNIGSAQHMELADTTPPHAFPQVPYAVEYRFCAAYGTCGKAWGGVVSAHVFE